MAFDLICNDIDVGISNVEIVFNSKRIVESRNKSAKWIEDDNLTNSIINIKQASSALSDSITKLNLIATKHPTELSSILQEVHNYIGLLINRYYEFSELNSCYSLFLNVSNTIRSLLSHIQSLLNQLKSGDFVHINSSTGMVWKTVEDISKLPVKNKASYRRSFMEDINVINDTIREFEVYLDKSSIEKNNHTDAEDSEASDGEGDEDEASQSNCDDEDQDTYTPAEITKVTASLDMMRFAIDLLKLSLIIMTSLGDQLHSKPPAAAATTDTIPNLTSDINALSLKPTHPSNNTYLNLPVQSPLVFTIDSIGIQAWIADLVAARETLIASITDFGCELYPPIDAGTTSARHMAVYSNLQRVLQLVSYSEYTAKLDTEVMLKLGGLAETLKLHRPTDTTV